MARGVRILASLSSDHFEKLYVELSMRQARLFKHSILTPYATALCDADYPFISSYFQSSGWHWHAYSLFERQFDAFRSLPRKWPYVVALGSITSPHITTIRFLFASFSKPYNRPFPAGKMASRRAYTRFLAQCKTQNRLSSPRTFNFSASSRRPLSTTGTSAPTSGRLSARHLQLIAVAGALTASIVYKMARYFPPNFAVVSY
jgi:hypothetical protein